MSDELQELSRRTRLMLKRYGRRQTDRITGQTIRLDMVVDGLYLILDCHGLDITIIGPWRLVYCEDEDGRNPIIYEPSLVPKVLGIMCRHMLLDDLASV